MRLKRVAVTGMGAISPYGASVEALWQGLLEGRSAVNHTSLLDGVKGMRTRLAALVPEVDGQSIPRKYRRSMSRMSIYTVLAAKEALAQAGLAEAACTDGRLGVSVGSTVTSVETCEEFFRDYFTDHSLERMKSGLFFKLMNHTCASNLAQALGITGRIMAPAAACATGCQAIGFAWEQIAFGRQERMLCGGAEEFHPLTAATFDVMNAASCNFNDRPTQSPRPFDRDRDGMVCGEGAGILLLEEYASARQRGATILAEIIGFDTLSDPSSIANPSAAVMAACMRGALADARVEPHEVDYVNAHATATEQGDVAEAEAIAAVFGQLAPVSSLKGHLGHTLAASGALELASSIRMMQAGLLVPTLNLATIDPACAGIRHLQHLEKGAIRTLVKNNFALGGVNSSLVLRRAEHD